MRVEEGGRGNGSRTKNGTEKRKRKEEKREDETVRLFTVLFFRHRLMSVLSVCLQ